MYQVVIKNRVVFEGTYSACRRYIRENDLIGYDITDSPWSPNWSVETDVVLGYCPV